MKRAALFGAGLALLIALLAPCLAAGVILMIPSLASEKFISAADGSTGPAFDACLVAWAVITALGFAAGAVPIVVTALRRERTR